MIVTGAGGGIGRPTAEMFAAAGARVMAVDLRQEAVDEVVAGMDGDGHVAAGCDLTDLDAQGALVDRAVDELGNVYALAHLAAVLRRRSSMDDVTEDDWDFQIDTNLKASFFLARRCANAMIAGGVGGRMVLFSSQGWWSGGFGGSTAYCASKGGIVSMSRGMARTYGPHQITVNVVSPGQASTSMLLTDLDPAVLESMTKDTPPRPHRRPLRDRPGRGLPGLTPRPLRIRSHNQRLRRPADVLTASGAPAAASHPGARLCHTAGPRDRHSGRGRNPRPPTTTSCHTPEP